MLTSKDRPDTQVTANYLKHSIHFSMDGFLLNFCSFINVMLIQFYLKSLCFTSSWILNQDNLDSIIWNVYSQHFIKIFNEQKIPIVKFNDEQLLKQNQCYLDFDNHFLKDFNLLQTDNYATVREFLNYLKQKRLFENFKDQLVFKIIERFHCPEDSIYFYFMKIEHLKENVNLLLNTSIKKYLV